MYITLEIVFWGVLNLLGIVLIINDIIEFIKKLKL